MWGRRDRRVQGELSNATERSRKQTGKSLVTFVRAESVAPGSAGEGHRVEERPGEGRKQTQDMWNTPSRLKTTAQEMWGPGMA